MNIRFSRIGVVTNSRLWLLDQYQQAFVERVVYQDAESQEGNHNESLHAFSVYFIHRVKGIVEDKKLVQQIGIEKQFRVKVAGAWYLTTRKPFEQATKGYRASLPAAGPLHGLAR